MKRVMDIIHNALSGVAKDRRGGVATFLAAAIIPLVAFSGLAVDTARGYLMKARLSYALDAAALAGARVMADPTERDATIARFFAANFPDGYMDSTIDGPHIVPDVVNKTITLDATANMGTSLMRIVGIDTMAVAASSQVTLSSRNIEVSVVLDITGSMAGTKIEDLKTAATDLVNIVVQDQQTPFFSKVALIPYSMAVNVGSYADQVRGPVPAPKAITGITRANPAVVTAPGHGFSNGDKVFIADVHGMTTINSNDLSKNTYYTVANANTNTFSLKNASGSSNISTSSGYSAYTSGGTVGKVCSSPGCAYYEFATAASGHPTRTNGISTCVTERIGANAYTDVAPSTDYVGKYYPNFSYAIPYLDDPINHPSWPGQEQPCITSKIVPLTSDKTTLTTEIDGLTAIGSTAGQIGVAWGWYLLSPNFGYLWTDPDSVPHAYNEDELVKIAVIMTDGEFNTIYANGIVAKDSGTGSGGTSWQINQNGSNGQSSLNQAQLLCSGMKTSGIEIYTIGFEVGVGSTAADFLSACATDASHAYLAADGSELQTVFHTIAMNISRLRLSK